LAISPLHRSQLNFDISKVHEQSKERTSYSYHEGFAFLKKHPEAAIIMDTDDLDINRTMLNNEHKNILDQDWSQVNEIKEALLPTNMPTPKGQAVKINMFWDEAHVTDLITRRSTLYTV